MLNKALDLPKAPGLRPLVAARLSAVGKKAAGPEKPKRSGSQQGGLVLSRHPGESIMIGGEVEVEVVGIKSGTVRLKISAPRSIPVHRREVFDAIQADPSLQRMTPERPATEAVRLAKPMGSLVLARTSSESIMIGDDVELIVVEVRPSIVKIKVAAPRSVAVHRREVFDAIRRDGQV